MQVKLKDVVTEFIVPMRDKPKKFDGDIPWCRIEDIQGKYLHGTLSNQFVSSETINEMNLRVCPKNTVLCTCSASIGIVAITSTELCTNQTFIGLVPSEEINYEYLYYYLTLCKKKLEKLVSKTTISYISRYHFENLVIDIPIRSVQDNVVHILSLLDKKIESNNCLINELESLCCLIYQYWFLQFEFPNGDGNPYKSSGGKMVWSEKFKKEIPAGWNVVKLHSKANVKREMINCDAIPPNGKYVGLEHIPRRKLCLDCFGTSDGLTSGKLIAEDGDILFGKIRPYLHKISISPWLVYCSSDTIVLNSIRPVDYSFVAITLFSDNFIQHATKVTQGSKMPRAEWNILKDYPIIAPDDEILKRYNDAMLPLIQKMKMNVIENIELAALRDFLLPLLMNGQVTFKDQKECPA